MGGCAASAHTAVRLMEVACSMSWMSSISSALLRSRTTFLFIETKNIGAIRIYLNLSECNTSN